MVNKKSRTVDRGRSSIQNTALKNSAEAVALKSAHAGSFLGNTGLCQGLCPAYICWGYSAKCRQRHSLSHQGQARSQLSW